VIGLAEELVVYRGSARAQILESKKQHPHRASCRVRYHRMPEGYAKVVRPHIPTSLTTKEIRVIGVRLHVTEDRQGLDSVLLSQARGRSQYVGAHVH
jgi:hypothetical protein